MYRYNRPFARNQFKETGEEWFLSNMREKFSMIFDVGSNSGEWACLAKEFNPKAIIHTFEVIPQAYERLLRTVEHFDGSIIPNSFGLSDTTEYINVKWLKIFDAMSTSLPSFDMSKEDWELLPCLVTTGDEYMASRGIRHIDLLKIDVEGMEHKVLLGFQEALETKKIDIIQFEYGYLNVDTKWLLKDFYKLLEPYGYQLGKLDRSGLHLKKYENTDENFYGPNIIAVINE